LQRPQRSIINQQIGSDFDWVRLRRQVLEPLQNDNPGHYQRYDWNTDSLAEWHNVPIGDTVIIEGNYTTRKELAAFYEVKIWIDCPRELRLLRGLERDGEKARPVWEDYWMPAEDLYLESHKPFDYADLIIDGSRTPDSVDAGFICLGAKKGSGGIFA
jgi:uridine kinase